MTFSRWKTQGDVRFLVGSRMPRKSNSLSTLCATGVEGLDHVLDGGLPPHRMYLLEGDPGVGKTTLALQFLRKGVEAGEAGLYITLSDLPR